MNIMVIGGGGREHALIQALKKSREVDRIYALPGNGGIAADATCVDIAAKDIPGMVAFAKENNIGFAVVAPDDPLAMGAVDELEAIGIPCFGPNKRAAVIEGSKAFAKELMRRYSIPTARYEIFTDEAAALAYLEKSQYPIVVKADGLALGKGVTVAQNREEASAAVRAMMSGHAFGASGDRVVIEECLFGPEVSVLALTDGKTIAPLASSMDHKRAYDEDKGPNTGGMGVIAPNPYYTKEIAELCMRDIFLPTIAAMNEEGRPFKGCLYFGLMLTKDGPKVIEYNCRFGDPETQAVLPLLETDLFSALRAVSEERLSEAPIELNPGAACSVVLASGGYPGKYETGKPIHIGPAAKAADIRITHAGTKLMDGSVVTAGGRVLNVTALADTLSNAVSRAYEAAADVSFENIQYRRDIGQSALKALRK
jgi:phosphoribosylamine--glycine ligase